MICKKTNKDPKINDINYEFHANSPNEICDEIDSTIPTSLSDSAHVTTIAVGKKELDGSSTRRPRSDNTDEIVPTSLLNFDPKHAPTATAQERQNNPNADIQDIITGIVKLLNGNVNVHANTQFPPPSTRRISTRINNRGPPRISEFPVILPGIESTMPQKTTPYPTGMRPPTVPYPFDFPPEKPLRNEHPIMMHNNKPVPSNRPPWHGSRTRPPIQITNTNRLQVPTRVSMNLPPQPSQDLRPPSKTVNPMTAYSTRIAEMNKMSDVYPNEKPTPNLMEQVVTKPITQLEPPSRETTRKPEIQKKTTRIPTTTPVVESTKEVPETPVSFQAPTTPALSSVVEEVTEAQVPAPFSHAQHPLMIIKDSGKISDLTKKIVQKTQETSMDIKTTEPIHTSVKSIIAPSRVQLPNQQIESSEFKSFYARPGIVLDDTDYTPGASGALEPSTQNNFHHLYQSTGVQSSATLSNIYAEIFDVTLSAIQGQPQHNKVVDLIEIGHDGDATDVIQTKLYNADGNDIIVSASDDNSFVSIDGKRTYINLFGETAETEQLKKPLKTQNDHRVYASKTVNLIFVCFCFVVAYLLY